MLLSTRIGDTSAVLFNVSSKTVIIAHLNQSVHHKTPEYYV